MTAYFKQKLWSLLPDIYQEYDKSGHLDQFLGLPAIVLDEIKSNIDQFPELFDLDKCAPQFLPLLGQLVGYRYNPIQDPGHQRHEIKEVIEFYRRKGTIPAMHRSLVRIGWEGEIKETYRETIRLNRRAQIGMAKLNGRRYSLGVYRVESHRIINELQEAEPDVRWLYHQHDERTTTNPKPVFSITQFTLTQ